MRHYLSDPIRWSELLGYIRLGWGPGRAAMEIGTSKRALDAFLKLDPTANEQFEDAVDYWRETIEGKLGDAILAGEAWAIAMALKAERPDKYGSKAAPPTTVIVGSAEDLRRLIEMAEQRPAPAVAPAPDIVVEDDEG